MCENFVWLLPCIQRLFVTCLLGLVGVLTKSVASFLDACLCLLDEFVYGDCIFLAALSFLVDSIRMDQSTFVNSTNAEA